MTAPAVRTRLLALRGEIDQLLEQLDAEPPPAPPATHVTVKEYAARMGRSERTVRLWIADFGLPTFLVGREHRIPLDQAERWLAAGGASRSRKSA